MAFKPLFLLIVRIFSLQQQETQHLTIKHYIRSIKKTNIFILKSGFNEKYLPKVIFYRNLCSDIDYDCIYFCLKFSHFISPSSLGHYYVSTAVHHANPMCKAEQTKILRRTIPHSQADVIQTRT